MSRLGRSRMITFATGITRGCALYRAASDLWHIGVGKKASAPALCTDRILETKKTTGTMKIHHGAVDPTMITALAPTLVMAPVRSLLVPLGICSCAGRRELQFLLQEAKRWMDDGQSMNDGDVSVCIHRTARALNWHPCG